MTVHRNARDIAPKVIYEFDMIERVARVANKSKTETSSADQPTEHHNAEQLTKNMLLEVFLLHTRVLYDFFIKSPKRDDVSAEHFFDNPSVWNSKKGTLCQTLRQEQRRLNKKLAHLTYSRLTEDEIWEINEIRNELLEAKQEFLGALALDQREWFV